MEKVKESSLAGGLHSGGLKVEGLSKKRRWFCLKDISFEVPPGSILGLLGRNGSGKTTIMKLLAGHTTRSHGNIFVNHVDMGKDLVLAQSQIGFVLDAPMFLEAKSLWENGRIFGRFYPEFTEKGWKTWLSACGLQKSDLLGQLSKGDRVKFQFAFAMSHHPKVLLLDEPTGNLDPVSRKEFLNMLLEVVENGQISVLFSSHLTTDLEQVADQVALLDQGEILYSSSMGQLFSRYCLIKGGPREGERIQARHYPEIVGMKVTQVGFEALLDKGKLPKRSGNSLANATPGWQAELGNQVVYEETDLSRWMYYMVKGGGRHGKVVSE